MKFSFEQLETFVAVAELHSFGGAAARLHTTQPNVSSRIAKLEQALQVVLFERNSGSVQLTHKGEDLLSHARAVLREAECMIEAVEQPMLFDGVLRLGVTELIVLTWLPEFLHQLKQRLPNIMVSLTVDLAVNLDAELQQASLDLVFQSNPFTTHTSGMLTLGQFPLVWVASPTVAQSLPDSPSIHDMAALPIITHAKNTKPYAELADHFSVPGLAARLVPSSNLTACAQMVEDGYGIAPLSLPLVQSAIASGKLIELKYEWQPSDLEFYARFDREKSGVVVAKSAELANEIAIEFMRKLNSKP